MLHIHRHIPRLQLECFLYKTKNALNKINDNLIVNSESNDYYNNGGGSVSGNEEVDTVDFADAENLDYREKRREQAVFLDTSYDIEKSEIQPMCFPKTRTFQSSINILRQ